MKLKAKYFFTLFMIFGAVSHATENNGDKDAQTWESDTGNPSVTITVADGMVIAKSNIADSFTTQQLQSANDLLLQDFEEQYVVIKDYTANGYNDIGIMKGAGYGGNHPCYTVYLYQIEQNSYDTKKTLTACK